MTKRNGLAVLLLFVACAAVAWAWHSWPRSITVTSGEFPEELIYVRSSDGIANGGVRFTTDPAAGDLAIIWVHGWGTNFYDPAYTVIGRALAARGLTTFNVNTRMHDLGTSAAYRRGRRVRGGGYWGVPSEQGLDLAAWVDFAGEQGHPHVVLVGHSAGWAAVAAYVVQSDDPRVVGVVLASGAVGPQRPLSDPELLSEARRRVRDGAGEDLIRLPNRNFPSFISAATLLDQAETPPSLLDFFGVETPDAGITRLRRPLLAFYGSRGDVGGEAELRIVEAAAAHPSVVGVNVETAIVDGGDHMYIGQQDQVADLIAGWVQRTFRPPT